MPRAMLRKRERELLNMCRGNGIIREDLAPADLAIAWHLYRRGWLNGIYRDSLNVFETSSRGLVELRRPAPPPAPGRIQCVNPICAKSALQEKHPGCDSIICGRCFKATGDLRIEYRSLGAQWRRAERLWKRHGERTTDVFEILKRRMDANWQAIVRFYTAPEKPEGLEEFLTEMGWLADDEGELEHHRQEVGREAGGETPAA